MKKYLVLGILFVLPILAYMFFASGVNNFGKLSVMHEGVTAPASGAVQFDGKITILGFPGRDIDQKMTNALNLNQKIYKRFNGFDDLQFVMLIPPGTEDKVADLKLELEKLTDIGNWNFVTLPEDEITTVFNSLGTIHSLNADLGTDLVFIVDKESRLRGREQDDNDLPLYGYDATSVAVINNKMVDDVKVILAEYRLSLKKNNNATGGRDAILKKK
ncbi:hypothetical protein [Robertkochia sediminum]|uniref:hypothetical protein n=1 Tax=Robertkochia sediminum TaxID=2785326 RepID=UPI001932489C|nr:hypothetical protein [Robertkochia sediminum]MBL7471994.1 hypothetical protein [Robertkochia sediminum]